MLMMPVLDSRRLMEKCLVIPNKGKGDEEVKWS